MKIHSIVSLHHFSSEFIELISIHIQLHMHLQIRLKKRKFFHDIITRGSKKMSMNFQDHVDRRIREMNERKRNFRGKKKCNAKRGN